MNKYNYIQIETSKALPDKFELRNPCTVTDVIKALKEEWLQIPIYTYKKYEGKKSEDITLRSVDVFRFRLSGKVEEET